MCEKSIFHSQLRGLVNLAVSLDSVAFVLLEGRYMGLVLPKCN